MSFYQDALELLALIKLHESNGNFKKAMEIRTRMLPIAEVVEDADFERIAEALIEDFVCLGNISEAKPATGSCRL